MVTDDAKAEAKADQKKRNLMRIGIVSVVASVLVGYGVRELVDTSATREMIDSSAAQGSDGALIAWLVMMAFLVTALVAFGLGTKDHWAGIFIDHRGKYSLSRIQIAAWSTVILSGLAAAAISNLEGGDFSSALEIDISPEVWALLGISSVTFAGASLVKREKEKQGVQPEPADSPAWSDIVQGEEEGNKDSIDMGKVQMLFFTALSVFIYAFAVGGLLSDRGSNEMITALPDVGGAMAIILGISHAGYLTYKFSPHTPPQS